MKKNTVLAVALFALMAVGAFAQTGTAGLAYKPDGNGYSVSKGTVTQGAVVIPASYNDKPVTVIASGSFMNTKITSVTIPNSVTRIMQNAFADCQNLTSVPIGNGVISIGGGAFSGCNGLTTITIPNSVINIGEQAFYDCRNLTSVTIPNSVTGIGVEVFLDCGKLTSVTFQGTINSGSFGSDSFPGDLRAKYLAGGIGTYTRPNGTSTTWTKTGTTTAAPAAGGTAGLAYTLLADGKAYSVSKGTVYPQGAVVIPATYNNLPVTTIGNFNDCPLVTAVTIPNSITNIGSGAFNGCVALTSITIPNSVTTIGNMVFNGCVNLTSVTFQGTIPSANFEPTLSFPGDLHAKFYATDKSKGTPGTYTRPNSSSTTWTKK